jgi:hypothetical protein
MTMMIATSAAWSFLRQADSEAGMLSPQGWALMLVSVAAVVILTAWCFARVLGAPPPPPAEEG